MTLSRRTFTTLAATGAFGLPALAAQNDRVSAEELRALLEERGELGIFESPEWLEMLREAMNRQGAVREALEAFPLSNDAEPVITFARY